MRPPSWQRDLAYACLFLVLFVFLSSLLIGCSNDDEEARDNAASVAGPGVEVNCAQVKRGANGLDRGPAVIGDTRVDVVCPGSGVVTP
ncbi:MAG TPA: hypothetical protein VJ301_14480 [Propionibacteriaceae bacterium]|nr:hypothetical protein [Propionibacteriaceae bacterium]